MKILIIGGTGMIGREVATVACAAGHDVYAPRRADLDLLSPPSPGTLPDCDAAVIAAGPKGFQPCEIDPVNTWRSNVDGVVTVGLGLMRRGAFLVFVSSDCVMWSASAYARQKAMVEMALLAGGSDIAIVRPSRVTAETAPALAKVILAALDRPGIHHWPS